VNEGVLIRRKSVGELLPKQSRNHFLYVTGTALHLPNIRFLLNPYKLKRIPDPQNTPKTLWKHAG